MAGGTLHMVHRVTVGRAGRVGAALGIEGGPGVLRTVAMLVADPAAVRPDIAEVTGHRLEFAHNAPGVRPVVVGEAVDGAFLAGAAVVAVAAVGAVEPHLEYRTVIGEQFRNLRLVHRQVIRRAVLCRVTVPWRAVNPEFESVFLRGFRVVPHQIALAVTPGRFGDVMGCGLRRPQAEAVVVLGNQDNPVHPAPLEGAHHLVGKLGSGFEKRGIFIAVAPLLVRIGVEAEVNEGEEFGLMPAELALRRNSAERMRLGGTYAEK